MFITLKLFYYGNDSFLSVSYTHLEHMTPPIIEYRGDPKRYISVVLGAIDRGRLTYNGDANCEQTFRSLSGVIDVISPKNGKALSVETLVSYEKKERAGEFSDYSKGNSE